VKESSFWATRLRPKLTAACVSAGVQYHFERVENAVASGTPDVDYCINGRAGKLELKYTPRHPARATTPVLGRSCGLRRSQLIWIWRRLRAGGRVYVVIGTPRTTWVIDTRGRTATELSGLELRTAPELSEISAWCADSASWATLPSVLVA
jgi:hypothetical protein